MEIRVLVYILDQNQDLDVDLLSSKDCLSLNEFTKYNENGFKKFSNGRGLVWTVFF